VDELRVGRVGDVDERRALVLVAPVPEVSDVVVHPHVACVPWSLVEIVMTHDLEPECSLDATHLQNA
jgi:hypothetical protein